MRWWVGLLVAGCACPEGFEKVDGECAPASVSGGTADEPLTEENFLSRFSVRACQEADACVDSDYIEVECDELPDFDTSCPYDADAAEGCFDGEWSCLVTYPTVYVTWPPACEFVYFCG
jgi:hypothetical protein